MKSNATKCSILLRDVPPAAYALQGDGRKGSKLREARRILVMQLASYANPDGSGISVGSYALRMALDWSRGKVFQRLDDLTKLGFLVSSGRVNERGNALRSLNLAVILEAANRSKSPLLSKQESVIQGSKSPGLSEQESRIRASVAGQESRIGEQESIPRMDGDRSTANKPPLPLPGSKTGVVEDVALSKAKEGNTEANNPVVATASSSMQLPARELATAIGRFQSAHGEFDSSSLMFGKRQRKDLADLFQSFGVEIVLFAWRWFLRERLASSMKAPAAIFIGSFDGYLSDAVREMRKTANTLLVDERRAAEQIYKLKVDVYEENFPFYPAFKDQLAAEEVSYIEFLKAARGKGHNQFDRTPLRDVAVFKAFRERWRKLSDDWYDEVRKEQEQYDKDHPEEAEEEPNAYELK